MKNKILLIFMVIFLAFNLTGCNEIHKAEKYITKGEYDKAEELYMNLLYKDSKDYAAYEGLTRLYREIEAKEKLVKIMEVAIKEGYIPKDNSYYFDMLSYYLDVDEYEKIEYLISKHLREVELPSDFYKEYLVAIDSREDLDLIDLKKGDLNNDGIEEIAVLYGMNAEDTYEYLRLAIYDKVGNVLYEMEEDCGPYGKLEFELADLTKDGILDVYYSSASLLDDFDTIGHAYVITNDNGKYVNVYERENIIYDIDVKVVNDNAVKVFSNAAKESYLVGLSDSEKEEFSRFNPHPVWTINDILELKKKDDKNIIEEKFTLIGFQSRDPVAEVCVDFGYFDGAWKPISLNVNPLNGKTIINSKKGEEYNDVEYGKNLLLGDWGEDETGSRYGILIDDKMIYLYEMETDLLEGYKYVIKSVDVRKKEIVMESEYGTDICQLDSDNRTLTITDENGNKTRWYRK